MRQSFFLILAAISFLADTAIANDSIPRPLLNLGPNSKGQHWSIYFKGDGTIKAVSTCKPEDRASDPNCRYLGSGVWSRKEGMVCYTIQEWGGNTASANPEHCEASQ
jgi:hypothetical protein